MHPQTPAHTDLSFKLKAILIAVTILSPLLIYFGTAESMVAIWNSSETFAHQYAILPISLWLIWKRRQTLALMTPVPYGPALILLALCGFVWLLGSLADVKVVKQYALVLTIVLSAVSLLGRRISWSIAFPLFFLLLAVPFGEIFINPLIEFTANFTVAALRATGMPVLREGNSFSIPSGHWAVVEACSGIRYLIASVTLGCLYAYLTYQSRIRQAVFVLISIVVPIIANGLRAYMIVMIGHLSGMRLAVGVDHLIYGWLFFGLVMFLMFWIGGFWHEVQRDVPENVQINAATPTAPRDSPVSVGKFAAYAACTVACIGIWPVWANYMDQAEFNAAHADLTQLRPSWQDSLPFTTWKPRFYPSDAELYRFFQHGSQTVGIFIYYYRNQNAGSMLISSSNRILSEKDHIWNKLSTSVRTESVLGRNLTVREELIQSDSGSLLIWHSYWIDGEFVENDYAGKLLQAKEKLTMRGDDGAALVVFAPYLDNPDSARQTLRTFLTENLSSVEAMLSNNRKP